MDVLTLISIVCTLIRRAGESVSEVSLTSTHNREPFSVSCNRFTNV